jgi:Fibronectin type III domain
MATPKIDLIKAVLGFAGVPDADLLSRCNAVHDGMTNNPAYPTPPIDMPGFKAAVDAYAAAIAGALDGGKAAIALRNKLRGEVIFMLHQLGHYVEGACKGDPQTFVSSGFVAVSRTRAPEQPVGQPAIASIDQGNSGQLVVTIKNVPKARHYELRYGAVPAGGGAINWTTILVATTKPPAEFNNLTPGGTYSFQVRAFGKLGYSDWSDPVSRMCI